MDSDDGPSRLNNADSAEKSKEQRRIRDLEQEIKHLEKANTALQVRQPGQKDINAEQRKINKIKLADLVQKFSLVE